MTSEMQRLNPHEQLIADITFDRSVLSEQSKELLTKLSALFGGARELGRNGSFSQYREPVFEIIRKLNEMEQVAGDLSMSAEQVQAQLTQMTDVQMDALCFEFYRSLEPFDHVDQDQAVSVLADIALRSREIIKGSKTAHLPVTGELSSNLTIEDLRKGDILVLKSHNGMDPGMILEVSREPIAGSRWISLCEVGVTGPRFNIGYDRDVLRMNLDRIIR